MSKKKKTHNPQTIDELLEISYGSNQKLKKQYDDSFHKGVLSPQMEKQVKELFSKLGTVDRISETNQKKTHDFKIMEKCLLLEVTSMKMPSTTDFRIKVPSERDLIRKVNDALNHGIEKDIVDYPEYNIIVVVYYDGKFGAFTDIGKREIQINLIKKSEFNNLPIAGFCFVPGNGSRTPNMNEPNKNWTLFYKDEMFSKSIDTISDVFEFIKI